MHDRTTKAAGTLHSHQTKATLTSNIGAIQHDKRSHKKKPALAKTSPTLLLKLLAAFCVLDCVGATPVTGPAPPSPHFVKPRHTVWHEGVEHESHVIVKLMDDRAVLDEPTTMNPELPAGLTAPKHTILSIGDLKLKAQPVFPTHRRRKLQATGMLPRDPLHLYFAVDAPDGNGAALCDQLNNNSSVEIAYLAPMPPKLPALTSSDGQSGAVQVIRRVLASKTELRRMLLNSEDYTKYQGYRKKAPEGFDFDVAAKYSSGLGRGITIAVLDKGVHVNHEDLGLENAQQIYESYASNEAKYHGDAEWGVLKGKDNDLGVRGGAVAVTPIIVNVPESPIEIAIKKTAESLQAGDVMLIAMQSEKEAGDDGDATFVPVEYHGDAWDAIRTAVNKGIVVVEAGGNGHMNLDAEKDGRFQRGHANFADSGAIMVGGGKSNKRTWHQADYPDSSSYGSRIDVQGWYDSVVTAGYGDLAKPEGPGGLVDVHKMYTKTFAGTSSASPLVAAAAAVMQSVARESIGRVLRPDELRALMVKTGTPQPKEDAEKHHIGPQPNLEAALARLSNELGVGGCCQTTVSDNTVATWTYPNGVPS